MALYLNGKTYEAICKDGVRYGGVWLDGTYYPFGSGFFYSFPRPGGEDQNDLVDHPERRYYLPIPADVKMNYAQMRGAQIQMMLYSPGAPFAVPKNPNIGNVDSSDPHYFWMGLTTFTAGMPIDLYLTNGQSVGLSFV